MSEPGIRIGSDSDLDECVALWVETCAVRDGRRVPGVDERARAKFEHRVAWLVADGPSGIAGFALATAPGSGAPSDPEGAAVLGLLAVAPDAQGDGLGRRLLRAAQGALAQQGVERVVLHVLADNAAAVRLYESEGWSPLGEPFEHTLLRRLSQTYARAL